LHREELLRVNDSSGPKRRTKTALRRVLRLEADRSIVSPFDATRSQSLNANNSLVQALYKFIDIGVKAVREQWESERKKQLANDDNSAFSDGVRMLDFAFDTVVLAGPLSACGLFLATATGGIAFIAGSRFPGINAEPTGDSRPDRTPWLPPLNVWQSPACEPEVAIDHTGDFLRVLGGTTVLVVGNRGDGETFPWGYFKFWLLNANLGEFEKI
jgi:hypothetical protein